jgi:hypothetical protein
MPASHQGARACADAQILGFAHHDKDRQGVNGHGMEPRQHGSRLTAPGSQTDNPWRCERGFQAHHGAPALGSRLCILPSDRGWRVLAAPTFRTAAKERNSCDPLGFARPFIPPLRRLRAAQIDGWNLPSHRIYTANNALFANFSDQARTSDVKQDSDFRTEIGSRKSMCLSAVPSVRQAHDGRLRNFPSLSAASAKYLTWLIIAYRMMWQSGRHLEYLDGPFSRNFSSTSAAQRPPGRNQAAEAVRR